MLHDCEDEYCDCTYCRIPAGITNGWLWVQVPAGDGKIFNFPLAFVGVGPDALWVAASFGIQARMVRLLGCPN